VHRGIAALSGPPSWTVYRIASQEDAVEVFVGRPRQETGCPACGAQTDGPICSPHHTYSRRARVSLTTCAASVSLAEAGSQVGKESTLYLRRLPRDLVREVKAEAARRGLTLTAFVAEALRHALGAPAPQAAQAAPEDELAQSLRWFEQNRTRLLRRYRGQYVAIYRNRVVDHDHDFDALARRVLRRFGGRPVCMPKVTESERVVHVPSPRIAGA